MVYSSVHYGTKRYVYRLKPSLQENIAHFAQFQCKVSIQRREQTCADGKWQQRLPGLRARAEECFPNMIRARHTDGRRERTGKGARTSLYLRRKCFICRQSILLCVVGYQGRGSARQIQDLIEYYKMTTRKSRLASASKFSKQTLLSKVSEFLNV